MSVADASLEPVTTTSRHQKRGFLLSLLTLLSLVGAFLGPPVDASASTRVAAETRVRAIGDSAAALVAADGRTSSTSVAVSSRSLRRLVSATGVATEEVANSLNLQSGGAAANTSVGQFGSGEDALSQAAGAADRRGFSAAGRSLTSMVLALARATPCFLEQRAISARSAPWRRGRRATF
jgi:hypothetical protein